MQKLSLVVPVYYEEECVEQFLSEAIPVLDRLSMEWEIVFVDDGSKDKTASIIKKNAASENRIKLIEFSYNQGKQAAVSAGIEYACGDYMIYMDPDLQDPPQEIPRLVEEIQKGFDIVYGVRKEKIDKLINKIYSSIFWGVLRRMTGLNLPKGLAVMRIFNRKFANEFLKYKEQNRFIEGIFMHIGLKESKLTIAQRERFAGKSKFSIRKKTKLATDAIFDFSELPLRMAVQAGLAMSFIGFISLFIIIFLKLFIIDFAAGWPSIISTIVLGFGIQLFFIGIAAIYIGKIYRESKNRPLFSIKELTNL